MGFLGAWRTQCPWGNLLVPSSLLFLAWKLWSFYLCEDTVDFFLCFHKVCRKLIISVEKALFFCWTWSKVAWELWACRGWGHPTGREINTGTHTKNRFLSAITSAGTETSAFFWPCHEPFWITTIMWSLSWKPWSPPQRTVLFAEPSFKPRLCLERCSWVEVALWPSPHAGDGCIGSIHPTCYKVIRVGFLQAVGRKK